MSELSDGVSRGQFLRNTAKGGLVLATSGGVLAAVDTPALAAGTSSGDTKILQAAYVAESLAVFLYSAIIKDFSSFHSPRLTNKDYFVAALRNEKDHKAALATALGKHKPTGLHFKIPASVTRTGQSLLNTGVALETAFVEAYLGAVHEFRSQELKLVAAKIAANEATHFSFFDAAAGPGPKQNLGGHGVLESFPNTATIAATERKLKPFLGS